MPMDYIKAVNIESAFVVKKLSMMREVRNIRKDNELALISRYSNQKKPNEGSLFRMSATAS